MNLLCAEQMQFKFATLNQSDSDYQTGWRAAISVVTKCAAIPRDAAGGAVATFTPRDAAGVVAAFAPPRGGY